MNKDNLIFLFIIILVGLYVATLVELLGRRDRLNELEKQSKRLVKEYGVGLIINNKQTIDNKYLDS